MGDDYTITPTGDAEQNGYRVRFDKAKLTIDYATLHIEGGATK